MSQRRFDQLRERLLRAGIAPRHVRRYVAELRDHFDDLLREETAKGLARNTAEDAAYARIGSDDALAAVMLARPGLRSYTARHPWAVFGLGSVLMLAVIVVAAILMEVGFLFLHVVLVRHSANDHPPAPEWLKLSVTVWNWLVMYVAPLAAAALLSIVGIKQRMGSAWIVTALAIICVLGGFHEIVAKFSDVPGRPSELSARLAFAPPFPREMILSGLFRAAINLALAGGTYWLWLRHQFSAAVE